MQLFEVYYLENVSRMARRRGRSSCKIRIMDVGKLGDNYALIIYGALLLTRIGGEATSVYRDCHKISWTISKHR